MDLRRKDNWSPLVSLCHSNANMLFYYKCVLPTNELIYYCENVRMRFI